MTRGRLTLVVAALLAGCGRGDDDAVVLEFWAMGAEAEVVAPLLREFEAAHPGVRVEVQQIPWTAAHEKLLTAHVGNSSPDVAQLGNTWIPEFAMLGAIAPLTARIGSDGVRAEGFFPGIWATNVVDSTVYGVPWYVDTRVLFYRTDILARAGVTRMPETWAEWRTAMEAVQRRAGPREWAVFLPTNEWAQPVIFGLQAGSGLLDARGRHGAFSEAPFQEAFDFYIGLFEDGLAPRMGNTDVANVYHEFARGTFAMYITGPWNLGQFRARLPDSLQGAWATAPLPGPEGPGASLAGGSSVVLFESSAHPEEAWALIAFLARPDVQARFFELSGNLPAHREAWADPALAADPRVAAFRAQLDRLAAPPQVPEWELIATRVINQAERAIRGNVPPAEVLRALDAQAEDILDKRRWVLDRRSAAGP